MSISARVELAPLHPAPPIRRYAPPFPRRGQGKDFLTIPFSPLRPCYSTAQRDTIVSPNNGGGAMEYSFPCPHRGKGGRRPDRGRGAGRRWLRLGSFGSGFARLGGCLSTAGKLVDRHQTSLSTEHDRRVTNIDENATREVVFHFGTLALHLFFLHRNFPFSRLQFHLYDTCFPVMEERSVSPVHCQPHQPLSDADAHLRRF